ncbi:hypothetical protein X797_002899 [Metarhizium robertsii]|uniref:Uncharacterized protein n=2 Tax=Metarhizium robertsii TaxID=568076 RepID=E9F3G2_METRA|nr:uncharacterized protein MAA_06924 [Metarhizium robertsii ARSEF 23]EFY97699.1 hypothetical protein MAA_06924 [Metarhizium robertsii ARSEF 23]EXV05211.1 hypothetical protein X797_002899 [Metarhizium robertsii]
MPQSACRYYFRAPTFDIKPESPATARLGSIFASLGELTNPLNQHDVIAIPRSSINASRVPNFKEVVKKGISGSAGIVGTLSHTLVPSEVLYTFAKDKTTTYTCAAMETYEFEASEQYVTDSITASLRVQDFISACFIGNNKVYMITGLKIAEGFSMSTTDAGSHGPACKVGLDALAMGAPSLIGPRLMLQRSVDRDVSHGPSPSKVIFAYRAIEIAPKRNGKLRYKPRFVYLCAPSKHEDEDEDEEAGWELEPVEEKQMLEMYPGALTVLVDLQ